MLMFYRLFCEKVFSLVIGSWCWWLCSEVFLVNSLVSLWVMWIVLVLLVMCWVGVCGSGC